MKKQIALLMALAMILSMAGCGGAEAEAPAPAPEAEQAAPQTEPPAEEPEEELVMPEFTEVAAVDNESCRIAVTEIDPEDALGYRIGTVVENKTAGGSMYFFIEGAAVNGVQATAQAMEEIAAGESKNVYFTLRYPELEAEGVAVTDIQLRFSLSDTETLESVFDGTCHIYPYGEEHASVYVREPLDTDTVVVDNEKVRAAVIGSGVAEDSTAAYSVLLYLENKSEELVIFTADDVFVNGVECDPLFSTTLLPGTTAYAEVDWSHFVLEDADITDPAGAEFTLVAYNAEDFSEDNYAEEPVSVQN